MTDSPPAAVVVLAAGQGTRMKSATAKVLHRICGRSLLGHVLAAVSPLHPAHTLVVVGHARDEVAAHLADAAPAARPVVQETQDGTGHAVRIALEAAPEVTAGTVVVVPGDAPLLRSDSLAALVDRHACSGAAATLLTAHLPDPRGYGRVVRDGAGRVRAIVEERDADAATREIHEVGASVYAFDAALLREALSRLGTDNAQGEEYLTDVVGLLVGAGHPVEAVTVEDWQETLGVNDRAQLATAGRLLRDRLLHRWMLDGVTVVDPASVWVDAEVVLHPDATIAPHTQLHGRTVVEPGAVVGPGCTLTDTIVGAGAVVVNAVCVRAEIGPEAQVGPFAYLRPGARLARGSKVGTFVEVKNSDIGEGSKVPHLSYVGDATIGTGTNIGAASVFVNYDGVAKHRTRVGDHARTGSDNMFVAPVTVGDGAYTGAGSVIRDDVPPGALAVSAGQQRIIDGWVERKRPGTPAAEAARRARHNLSGDGEQGDTP